MLLIDPTRLNAHVLAKQHLAANSKINDVVQIVGDIGGLQATNPITPYLSLLARSQSFAQECLEQELYVKRTLGRMRCMRKAIYILTPELLVAAHWATRSATVEASRRYLEFHGISYREYHHVSQNVLQLLKDHELTASEIKRALKLRWDVGMLLSLMCDQGLLIRGHLVHGWATADYRYALFTDYFPNWCQEPMSEREATMRLVRHYLKSFGPATEDDLAWWTGLGRMSVHIAIQHMRGEVIGVRIENRAEDYLTLRTEVDALQRIQPLDQPIVNLLPSHDPYLTGYLRHERYSGARHIEKVFDWTGNVTSTILLTGRAIGVWDFRPEESMMKLFLLEEANGDTLSAIEAEAQRIGRFINGGEIDIRWCADMTPLTRQPAGNVTSPLKEAQLILPQ